MSADDRGVSDGSVKWLDRHFTEVIQGEMVKLRLDLVATFEKLLDRTLGDLPRRVDQLERTRLRLAVSCVAVAATTSVCTIWVGVLFGWWRL